MSKPRIFHSHPHLKVLSGSKRPDDEQAQLALEFWENAVRGTSAENGLLIPGHSEYPSHVRAGLGLAWLQHFSRYSGDNCLLFPFRTNHVPRGSVTYNYKRMPAHRAMCFLVHRMPPEGKTSALHKCGNGHLGCVTPNHLYWGDASDNTRDMWLHLNQGKPLAQGGKVAAPRPDKSLPRPRSKPTQR